MPNFSLEFDQLVLINGADCVFSIFSMKLLILYEESLKRTCVFF